MPPGRPPHPRQASVTVGRNQQGTAIASSAGVLTLDQWASRLHFDRPVLNRTGIAAPVSVRLEYSQEDSPRGEATRESWMSALRNQLGLDIRESKGPVDFLVLDHVERPTPNSPAEAATPPVRALGAGRSR
jgi:uncharacterized protein (TIGR03435 family)